MCVCASVCALYMEYCSRALKGRQCDVSVCYNIPFIIWFRSKDYYTTLNSHLVIVCVISFHFFSIIMIIIRLCVFEKECVFSMIFVRLISGDLSAHHAEKNSE